MCICMYTRHTHTHTHIYTHHSHTYIHTRTHTHTHTYTTYRYHSPTAYSAVSMSPIELSFLDAAIIAPIFLVPINATVYMLELAYIYYFGLMDHSGVLMHSWFPWQPHTKFHDDHHRYVLLYM